MTWCLLALTGLTTAVVVGLGGSVLLIFSLSGVLQDPSAGRALQGVAAALAVLAVTVLVLTPGVCNDFEARRLQEELRARQAATAARRARTL